MRIAILIALLAALTVTIILHTKEWKDPPKLRAKPAKRTAVNNLCHNAQCPHHGQVAVAAVVADKGHALIFY